MKPFIRHPSTADPIGAPPHRPEHRRGAIVILSALILVILFGMLAFSIDLGYIAITRSELQSAADGAALAAVDEIGNPMSEIRAAARDVASNNTAASEPVDIDAAGNLVVQGKFDETTRTFTPTNTDVNSVRVSLEKRDMPLMFAKVLGTDTFDARAEAIAMVNPRDIVLVVDLSGSMNNDTETSWATELIDRRYAGTSDDGVGTRMAQDLYDDLGFGTFPGRNEHVGANAYEYVYDRLSSNQQRTDFANDYRDIPDYYREGGELTGNRSPLRHERVPGKYRIRYGDNESQRRTRAYRWIMDHQLRRLMPAARPVPNGDNSASRAYWFAYLDYVMYRTQYQPWYSNEAPSFSRRNGSTREFYFPEDYTHRKVYALGNPSSSAFPDASWSVLWKDLSTVGYRSYVNFMNDYGWNGSPQDSDSNLENPARPGKVQLSKLSPHCPWRNDAINGEEFSFPPRTQPMHACRRSMIAALQTVRERNDRMAESAADRVAIITYDAVHTWSRPTIVHDLDNDYDGAMQACTELQACYDGRASTATENALILAREVLKTSAESNQGQGRKHARKIIVLLTDGRPNLYETPDSQINQFISNNPSSEYYGSNQPWMNAPLMQATQAQRDEVMMFGLSMGMGSDSDFMGRLARLANTDKDGNPLSNAGDPSRYEAVLTEVLRDIINNAGIRLVK